MTSTTINPSVTPAERMRTSMTAVRVSIRWFGVRKTLTPEQKEQAAESFGAEGQFLSAAKKLLDTKHPAYKAVSAARGQILGYWRGMTLPYPEPGIRLIRQDHIEAFDARMRVLAESLDNAVQQLDEQYAWLRTTARDRLGQLYDEADYPASLHGMFGAEWDFPSVQPPDYLRQLSPKLWEQECARVARRFDEAVNLAEQAFIGELSELVSHITERLTDSSADGTPKIFRNSAVTKLHEFFERFRNLNVRSNQQLDELVQVAQQAVRGVAPDDLRASNMLRQQVAGQMSTVKQSLDEMLIDRPRRRILRGPVTGEVA